VATSIRPFSAFLTGSIGALALLGLFNCAANNPCTGPLGSCEGNGGAADPCLTPIAGTEACSSDSQCPEAGYCNVTLTACGFDGGDQSFTTGPGRCLPVCGVENDPCHFAEDCPVADLCLGSQSIGGGGFEVIFCNSQACDGRCGTNALFCPSGEFSCPAPCSVESVPHAPMSCAPTCICPTCPG
jgi:hypothetical protein